MIPHSIGRSHHMISLKSETFAGELACKISNRMKSYWNYSISPTKMSQTEGKCDHILTDYNQLPMISPHLFLKRSFGIQSLIYFSCLRAWAACLEGKAAERWRGWDRGGRSGSRLWQRDLFSAVSCSSGSAQDTKWLNCLQCVLWKTLNLSTSWKKSVHGAD